MAVIKKLNQEEKVVLDFSSERIVRQIIDEKQVDEVIGMMVGGETVLVYDKPGENGQAHTLVDKVRKYFGSQRVDLIPLMDEEANKLGVKGDVGSFVVRKRPIEL